VIGAEFLTAVPKERKPEPPAQGVVGVDPDLNARSAGLKARGMKAQGNALGWPDLNFAPP
jgi:hypothetical protein